MHFHYTYFEANTPYHAISLFSFAQNNWRVSRQGAETCGTAGWWESHRVAVSLSIGNPSRDALCVAKSSQRGFYSIINPLSLP